MNSTPAPARLRPFRPVPFGRYTLLSHLATGGMGELYLARMDGAGGFEKLYVIKRVLPHLARDPEIVERFMGEARHGARLHHGSIAQVLELGMHEGQPFIVLEYVDGKDLRKVAARAVEHQRPLPLTFVLWVMSRMLDALAYAHRKSDDEGKELQLIHRDVSPQNVLVSYEGEVKVIDFGLAKSRLSLARTHPSVILGKFLYMAPEQARHQAADRRSDLYSAGICLYELLAGGNPFALLPPNQLLGAVAHPLLPSISERAPHLPASVVQLVSKATAAEPADRFQTAEEFRGKVLSCLMEVDPSTGAEAASRVMHELFVSEYQLERRLLASWKEPLREEDEPPLVASALSFNPTPRTRSPADDSEGNTRPGVLLDESTRPAASLPGGAEAMWGAGLPHEPHAQDTEAILLTPQQLETLSRGPPAGPSEMTWDAPPGALTPPPVRPLAGRPPVSGAASLRALSQPSFDVPLDLELTTPGVLTAPPPRLGLGFPPPPDSEPTPVSGGIPVEGDAQGTSPGVKEVTQPGSSPEEVPWTPEPASPKAGLPPPRARVETQGGLSPWSLEPELTPTHAYDPARTTAMRVPAELLAQIEDSGAYHVARSNRRRPFWKRLSWGWLLLGGGLAVTVLLVWWSERSATPPAPSHELSIRALQPLQVPDPPVKEEAAPEETVVADETPEVTVEAPVVSPAEETSPEVKSPAGEASEDELLAPLTPAEPDTLRKRPPEPPPSPLQQEWGRTRASFQNLTRLLSCEDRRMALLCTRYLNLQEAVRTAGPTGTPALILRVRAMNQELTLKRKELL